MRQGTSFLCEMWCGWGAPFLEGLYGLPPILKGLYPSLPLGCCCATFSSSWVLILRTSSAFKQPFVKNLREITGKRPANLRV